jgi:hypothetical protein
MLSEIGGTPFVFHGGATNGHLSSFELAPSRGFALTLLTNADTGRGLRPFVSELLRHHFLGISPASPPSLPLDASVVASYTGRYAQAIARLDVAADASGLVVQEAPALFRTDDALTPPPVQAVSIAPDRFAILHGERRGETIEFLRGPAAEIDWMRWDGRISRRITT